MKRIVKLTTLSALGGALCLGGTALAGGEGYHQKEQKAEVGQDSGSQAGFQGEEGLMEEEADVGAEARGDENMQFKEEPADVGAEAGGEADVKIKEEPADVGAEAREQPGMEMGGQQPMQHGQMGQQQMGQQQTGQQQLGQQTFSGEVIRTKQVDIRGGQDKSMAVMIRTDQGQHIVADLGPTKDLKSANIKKGDKVSLKGELAQIGDRNVLFADQVDVRGKKHNIDRTTEVGQQSRGEKQKSMEKEMKKDKADQPMQMDPGIQ